MCRRAGGGSQCCSLPVHHLCSATQHSALQNNKAHPDAIQFICSNRSSLRYRVQLFGFSLSPRPHLIEFSEYSTGTVITFVLELT